MATKRVIEFKLTSGSYGFLANFYKKIFIAEGIKWRTSEHYYQYKKMKFLQDIGEPITDEILQSLIDAKTARDVKRIGHIKCNNIDKWDEVKVDAMMDVLRAKFTYDRFIRMLLETEDAILVESSYYDTFWGNGGYSKNGLNMLGKCLMRIRAELKQATTEQAEQSV